MNKGFWKLQRRGWLVRDLRTDDVVSSFLSYASYGARETWNLETLMYTDIQTNKGTGQRIRKEKPNRAKMGRGVLTPTSQGARQRSPIALRATLEPLLHLFLWVLVSRLIHCRQHQHSLAWLCPPPNGMRRSRPSGFNLSTSLGWRWPFASACPRKATSGSTCRDWARAT